MTQPDPGIRHYQGFPSFDQWARVGAQLPAWTWETKRQQLKDVEDGSLPAHNWGPPFRFETFAPRGPAAAS